MTIEDVQAVLVSGSATERALAAWLLRLHEEHAQMRQERDQARADRDAALDASREAHGLLRQERALANVGRQRLGLVVKEGP
jgi:hypothetical protein